VYDLLFLVVVAISGLRVAWVDSVLRIILPSALLNALFAPPVLGGMRWLYRRSPAGREEVAI
jgi:hypothetical protein